MTLSDDSDWQNLSPQVQRALSAGWNAGAMPTVASALYSRWWLLETWLRSLVYIELRSANGAAWADGLSASSASRQRNDEKIQYMQPPDAQDQLAYLDAGLLLRLTHDEWPLFGAYVPAQKIWAGRIEELKEIQNRIGHCRRPHEDDLDRLEQTLRDLNGGAFRATSSFKDQSHPNEHWSDGLVRDWLREAHSEGDLEEHARRQYETTFSLAFSSHPWAQPLVANEDQLGCGAGYIWHARWYFCGGRTFNLAQFWEDIEIDRDLIMVVCADTQSSLQVSFSALDDQQQVGDVIGRCFHAALTNLGYHCADDDHVEWAGRYAVVDPRVHAATPWAMIEPSTKGCIVFSA